MGVAYWATNAVRAAFLAAWYVFQGLEAEQAIAKVRQLRPGSIETDEQIEAVREYGRRRQVGEASDPVA